MGLIVIDPPEAQEFLQSAEDETIGIERTNGTFDSKFASRIKFRLSPSFHLDFLQ